MSIKTYVYIFIYAKYVYVFFTYTKIIKKKEKILKREILNNFNTIPSFLVNLRLLINSFEKNKRHKLNLMVRKV